MSIFANTKNKQDGSQRFVFGTAKANAFMNPAKIPRTMKCFPVCAMESRFFLLMGLVIIEVSLHFPFLFDYGPLYI